MKAGEQNLPDIDFTRSEGSCSPKNERLALFPEHHARREGQRHLGPSDEITIKDPSIPMLGAATTFKSLPLEVREMIYVPLITGDTIKVCLLRTKRDRAAQARHRDTLNAILFVDKQIHSEVANWFYKNKTCVIGNGWFG